MKKKLLLIFTTILLAFTTFTSNVFADYTTAGDVFDSTSTSYKLWSDKNGQTFGDLATDDIESENVSKNAANDYTFSWSNKDFYLLMEGDILKSIVVYDSNPAPDGTYLSTYRDPNVISIGSILPDDFPTDVTSGWSNGLNNIYVVHETDGIKVYGANHLNLYDEVTPEGSNYYIAYLGGKITFVMSGSKFSKITISGFPSPYTDLNGDYVPQIHISDILPDDFPQSIQAGFINENGKRAYKEVPMSSLKVGSVTLGLNNPVTQVGNDYSYTYGMSPNQTYLFKITNGKVSSIVVSGCSDSSEDGTYSLFRIIEQTSSCNVGYNGDVKIRINAYYPNTSGTKVYVDGVEKTEGTDYEREQGSLIITFKSSFISTLSVSAGSHPFKINVPDCPEINGYITFSNPSSGGGGGSSRHAVLNTGVSSFTSK